MVPSLISTTLLTILQLSVAPPSDLMFGGHLILQGRQAFESGKIEQAHQMFEQTFQQWPNQKLHTRLLAAKIALASGHPKVTLRHLKRIEAAKLQDVALMSDFIHALRAQAFRALSQWEQTTNAWKQVLLSRRTSPWHAQARYGLADALYARGHLKQALKHYKQALKKHRRSQWALGARLNIAQITEQLGEPIAAAKLYEKVIRHNPNSTYTQTASQRITALHESTAGTHPQTYPQQIQHIDQLLQHRQLALAQQALGKLQKHQLSTEQQVALSTRQGILAYRHQQYDIAINYLKKASKPHSHRDWYSAKRWLARSFSAKNKPSKAIQQHLEVAKNAKDRHLQRRSLFWASWLAYHNRLNKQAHALFSQYLKKYPKHYTAPIALWYHAWSQYHATHFKRADKLLERWLQRFPKHAMRVQISYWRGRIAEQTGRTTQAQRFYQDISADHPGTYYALLSAQRLGAFAAKPNPNQPTPPRTQDPPQLVALDLPWDIDPALQWQSTAGQRTIRFLQISELQAAAFSLRQIPGTQGQSASAISYARARLLHALGQYRSAFRIAVSQWPAILNQPPTPTTRPFHQLAYPLAHNETITLASTQLNIAPTLLMAIMRQESIYTTAAESAVGARGLMQILPNTGKNIARLLDTPDYDDTKLFEPKINIQFGAWYLTELIRSFRGHPILAIASYNAGPTAVKRWIEARSYTAIDEFIEDIPYRETRHYTKKVIKQWAAYRRLYYGNTLIVPMHMGRSATTMVDF